MSNEWDICDQTDTNDAVINGVVRFEPQNDDCSKMQTVQKILDWIRTRYEDVFKNFDVDISLNDVNFSDGWLDYSIEGDHEDMAFAYWCSKNDIELPCPEFP